MKNRRMDFVSAGVLYSLNLVCEGPGKGQRRAGASENATPPCRDPSCTCNSNSRWKMAVRSHWFTLSAACFTLKSKAQ